MEEERVEHEFVGEKELALSSNTQTLDSADAKTIEVLVGSIVCNASVAHQGKVDVSKIGKLVEVEMNDEAAKSQVKSTSCENAGDDVIVTSDVKAKCGVLDNHGNDSVIFFPNANQKAGNEPRGVSMKPIPTDLIMEIFLRLPAKSVGRFRSLSKQWCSTLSSPDFIKMHLSRSAARPRLLFAVERKGVWRFFSSPQSSSTPLVAADFHTSFSEDVSRFTCSYAYGLFYFRDLWNPNVGQLYVVCNPVTGQYVTLPGVTDVDMYKNSRGFLGFDPVEKQFKVLAKANQYHGVGHVILTLGTGEVSWRRKSNDCPPYSLSLCEGICINGAIYYLVLNNRDEPQNAFVRVVALRSEHDENYSIVRFDMRSETFKLVAAKCFVDPKTTKLVNYKGKLVGVDCIYGEANGKYTLELRLCVLDDVEKHEWSTYVYTLPENELIDDPSTVSVAGMTVSGEIVLAMDYTFKPYYVFYFDPENNTMQSVEIQGFGAELEAVEYRGRVSAFVDHVEHLDVEDFKHSRTKHTCTSCKGCIQDLNVVDLKQLGSSIFGNQGKRFCSNCEEQEKKETQ